MVYTHKSDAAKTMEYSYDVHNRLIEFKHEGSVLRDYEYDANGNRRDAGNEIFAYANNNNQLTAFDNGSIAISFTFDAAGRVKQIGSTDLKYDNFNNMTEHGSGNKYTYDAANQRLRKTENGDSTYYVTNGLQVLAEYDENDNLQAEHIYGLGRILAKFEPGVGHTFFYSDHLGSTRLVGGSSESSDDMRRDFYPYGEELTAAGNDDTPYTFTGKELDSATGLHYIVARYYDPTIGRWYVPDALADRYLAWSPYNYALGNPVSNFDPDGKEPLKARIATHLSQVLDYISSREGNAGEVLSRSLPIPGNTERLFRGDEKMFVATKSGFIVDMEHFIGAAAMTHVLSGNQGGVTGSVGKVVAAGITQLVGLALEVGSIFGETPLMRASAFSQEDVPSNILGSQFALFFDPNRSLGPQVLDFLLTIGAITKDEYAAIHKEQFDRLPEDERELEQRQKRKELERLQRIEGKYTK